MILSVLMNECSEIINVCIHGDTLPGQLGAMFLSRSTLTSMEIFMILAATVHAACGLTRTSLLEALTCSVGLMGLCPATVSVSPHCGQLPLPLPSSVYQTGSGLSAVFFLPTEKAELTMSAPQ